MTTMEFLMAIVGIVLGSNGLFAFIQFLINRKSVLRKTLAAVAYKELSNSIERCLDQDYATPEERRDLEILFDAYKANGWNGDMDARMQKVYALPTKKVHN